MTSRQVLVDAGDIALPGGRRIVAGQALRVSGGLTRAEELRQLEEAHLVALVDLRGTDEERAVLEDWAAGHGVEYDHQPIQAGTIEQLAARAEAVHEVDEAEAWQLDLYMSIVDGFAPAFAHTLTRLAGPGPVGFGCAAGKDRTGIATAFLHVLLGLSEEEAAAHYVRLAPDPAALRPLVYEHHGLEDGAPLSAGYEALLSVRATLMEGVFARVRETHGGLEAYLCAAGFPHDGAERLRARLVA